MDAPLEREHRPEDPGSAGRRVQAAQGRGPARTAAALGLMALIGGCTTVIVPPTAPSDPVSVFLLDHGRHASLVLPLRDGGAVRYSYGDWDWYVLDRTGIGSGLRALFWPTPAALGRKLLAPPVTDQSIRRQLRVAVMETLEIRVSARAAHRLGDELASRFAAALHTRHHSAVYDVEFVRDEIPYTVGHNSNRVVAEWLESLGCEVRGRPVLSDWRLEEARPDGAGRTAGRLGDAGQPAAASLAVRTERGA